MSYQHQKDVNALNTGLDRADAGDALDKPFDSLPGAFPSRVSVVLRCDEAKSDVAMTSAFDPLPTFTII